MVTHLRVGQFVARNGEQNFSYRYDKVLGNLPQDTKGVIGRLLDRLVQESCLKTPRLNIHSGHAMGSTHLRGVTGIRKERHSEDTTEFIAFNEQVQ